MSSNKYGASEERKSAVFFMAKVIRASKILDV